MKYQSNEKEQTTMLKKWNKILAKEGLSVWEGTDHRMVYTDQLPMSRSAHLREFVDKERSAGDSDNRLYEQAALADLTDRERKFLGVYQQKSVPEVAAKYETTVHAVYCRIGSIRRKILATAKALKERH